MKRFFSIISLIVLASFAVFSQSKSEEILQKLVNNFFNRGGIEANYSLKTNKNSSSGVIKIYKQKFAILNPSISTWYDGETQWNYNIASNEVTITEPSQEELELISPYNIIVDYQNKFTSTLVKSKIGGTFCIVLKPKTTSTDIKKVVLYVKASNYNLVRADITMSNNVVSTFILTNVKSGLNIKKEEFIFPTNKYKKAKIIDLR